MRHYLGHRTDAGAVVFLSECPTSAGVGRQRGEIDLNPHHETMRNLVALLADKRYSDLIRKCSSSRIAAEEMEAAVGSYGRTIVQLAEEGLRIIDSVEVQNGECQAWSVVVPLFTREEGRSDLSLELTLTETQAGVFSVEPDDLRVR